jgi:hypothetical protein
MIPLSELPVEDTWFLTGMSGAASNTLVAEEVFVPVSALELAGP